eukprot:3088420-Karenia_brevis.AAC.1
MVRLVKVLHSIGSEAAAVLNCNICVRTVLCMMSRRVRALLKTQHAARVAKNTVRSCRKTCAEVVRKKGAATRG